MNASPDANTFVRMSSAGWSALSRFLNDGRIDLDTSLVGRSIRPSALGRKNALFVGSEGDTRRWAIVASLVETAKLNGVEPFAWLRDALNRLVDGSPNNYLDELLPWFPRPAHDYF
ncbi:MAG: transposase domain-containing protein [Janthinobacterium lividum]